MSDTLPRFAQRYLGPGARVHVVAPAGPFAADDFERGVARLRRRYDVQYAPEITARAGLFAGSDARRLRELQTALADPKVDAVLAARGGHGVTRILPALEVADVHARAPLLIGFSDITALHALWARARVGSVHGSMVAALGRCSEPLFERFCAAIEGRYAEQFEGLQALAPGRAEGVLLGGNLAVLTALLGTPYFPPLRGAVLFLEDIGERPYRIDRMLTTWRNAGALEGVRAIVLGTFVQAPPGPDGVSVEQVLTERLSDLGIPVASGIAAGHIDDNAELPFGVRVQLDADAGRLSVQAWRA